MVCSIMRTPPLLLLRVGLLMLRANPCAAQGLPAAEVSPPVLVGLPMSSHGCPDAMTVSWTSGYVHLQSPAESAPPNTWSDEFHVAGPATGQHFRLNSCGLVDRVDWPAGRYCVFRYTDHCPAGFYAEETMFSPAMPPVLAGHVPVNADDDVTLMFCCRRDDPTTGPESSPFVSPFVLFPDRSEGCPQFTGYRSREEYFYLAHVTSGTVSAESPVFESPGGRGLNVTFCHFDTEEPVQDPCEADWEAFGSYCYQFQEAVRSWDEADRACQLLGANLHSVHSTPEMEYIRNMTQYLNSYVFARLEQFDNENYWTGLNDIQVEMEWSYSDGTPNVQSAYIWSGNEPNDWLYGEDCQEWRVDTAANNDFNCWAPRRSICKKPRLSVKTRVARDKPSRQSSTEEGLSASLAVDASSLTCTQTGRDMHPWWQVDLQEVFIIEGVEIVTGPKLPGVVSVTAGVLPDDFRSHGALTCISDLLLPQRVTLIKCMQPIRGQYVTIQVTSSNLGSSEISERLELCNVYVYGTGTYCGVPLGLSTGEVHPSQLSASSYMGHYFPHRARLSIQGAWCLESNLTDQYLQIELESTQQLYGLIVSGLEGVGSVTRFHIAYSTEDQDFVTYQEYAGVDKVFDVPSDGSVTRYVLHTRVNVQTVRVLPLDHWGKACLQLELMGCRDTASVVERCPTKVGVQGLALSNTPTTTSVIIHGTFFPCDAHVTGWEIFSAFSGYDIIIAIWRPQDNGVLRLVHATTVSLNTDGKQEMTLSTPVAVKSTDYVGLHLGDTSAKNNLPVPYAISGEDGILSTEVMPVLFVNIQMTVWEPGTELLLSEYPGERKEAAMAVLARLDPSQRHSSGGCGGVMTSEGMLQSPHYPSYYGSAVLCVWNLVAPVNKFVRLDFEDFDLTPAEVGYSETVSQLSDFSETQCADSLTVRTFSDATFTADDTTLTLRQFRGTSSALIISDTSFVRLELTSCIRDSPMVARGFLATVSFTNFYGCCVGTGDCAFCECRDWERGYISSVNFPIAYHNNMACTWRLIVQEGNYIELQFESLDVAAFDHACQEDNVVIRDTTYEGEETGEPLMFCNHIKPDRVIKSSWHYMIVTFYTDFAITDHGFLAKYESKKYDIDEELKNRIIYEGEDRGCDPLGIFFAGFCYQFHQPKESLVWLQAETNCLHQGGHLVSIMSDTEMKVIHYLLTTRWRTDSRDTYIGLYDENPRSQFWWTDKRPLIYAAWAPKLDNLNVQPDGADLESCTMIQLSNLHSINHWHDIPCSTDTVHQYICKRRANPFNGLPINDWSMAVGSGAPCGEDLFTCSDGTCIQQTFVCDGVVDCRYSLDEYNCTSDCSESEFQCADGGCVHMSKYCDFLIDCDDHSDEKNCVYPPCKQGEWSCDSGQCIPLDKRCDVIPDCADKSDEQRERCNLVQCSAKDTMQCYWGKCVAQHVWCDTVVDCAGTLEEDERGCQHTRAQTCTDLRVMGYPEDSYSVRPNLLDSIEVNCTFDFHTTHTSIPSTRLERLLTETESSIDLVYGSRSTRNQIEAILDSADTCWQNIHLRCGIGDCFAAVNLHYQDRPLHHLDITDWNCSCTQADMREAKNNVDTIRISHWDILHVDSVQMAYINSSKSGGFDASIHVIVEPIQCTENTSSSMWPDMFRCNSGQFIDSKYRCLLEFDKYGLPFGCRDMSHLFGCDVANVLDKECGTITHRLQYTGSVARARGGHVCQRWDAQTPHMHSFRSTELFQVPVTGTMSDQENYCRNPWPQEAVLDLPVPWCLVANPVESNRENCPKPPCHELSGFAEWATKGYTYPYEAFLAPCDIPMCAPEVVGVKLPFECPPYFVVCPGHYCIPARYVCDGRWHCPDGEDEQKCDTFVCPGMYQCRGHSNCLNSYELCDGVRQCPDGDDELYCDVTCPTGCTCQGYVFSCSGLDLKDMPRTIVGTVRKLDISNNSINLTYDILHTLPFLGELNASSNGITLIESDTFRQQENLYILDLTYNSLKILYAGTFNGLKNLKHLLLSGNHLLEIIEPGAFEDLGSLPQLDLSGLSIGEIKDNTFSGLSSLSFLNLAKNKIAVLFTYAFGQMEALKRLDISGNSLESAGMITFRSLVGLEYLTSDSFKFCCFASQVPSDQCLPPQDEISSCSDLMRNNILRSFLWVLGIMAFVGNIFVLAYRYRYSSEAVSEMAIFHLGISDFLMGLYMLCIAGVDSYYRGVYIEFADQWKTGVGCQILGFLATLSSEGSVLFLCLITIDRFICLVFPFSDLKLRPSSGRKCIAFIWILTLILAGLPLFPIDYFGGLFYSRSGVCIALPITAETPPGWEYSTALFIGFNLSGFMVIAVGYSVMYVVIQRTGKRARRGKNKAQITLARNMMLIVMTDFVCWLPIIIMGFLALRGTKLSGEVYSWTIVFILPINSAINPLLYSYAAIKQKRAKQKKVQQQGPSSTSVSRRATITEKGKAAIGLLEARMEQYAFGIPAHAVAHASLTSYLKTAKPSVKQLYHVLSNLTGALHALHSMGMVHGNLTTDGVLIEREKLNVLLTGFLYDDSADDYDTSDDMESLGNILKTLIRAVSN